MNASLRCPDGHVTQATDYCDVCGLPMSLSAMAPDGPGPGPGPGPGAGSWGGYGPGSVAGPGPGNGYAQAAPEKDCPNCGYIVPGTDLFCENCGYDFTTGQLPVDPGAMMPHGGPQPGYGAGYGPGYGPGYDQGYNQGHGPGYGPEPGTHYAPDPGPGYAPDHGPVYPDQGPGYGPDHGTGYGPDHGADDGPDYAPGYGPDHGPDQGGGYSTQAPPQPPPPQSPPPQLPPPQSLSSSALPPPLLGLPPDYPAQGQQGQQGQSGQPSQPGADQAGPLVWVAELWVDPDWFATQESGEPCPSSGMPIIVPLWDRSLLIGRVSVSRNIHPQIDCGTDHGVSRRHAQLTSDGQRWWIEDLQSSNGTFVGPAGAPLPTIPVRPGQRTEFAAGDRIYVGAWSRLVVRRATPDEA